MVQPTFLRKKIKFPMDTGCGHDLISQKKTAARAGDFGDTRAHFLSDSKWHHRY